MKYLLILILALFIGACGSTLPCVKYESRPTGEFCSRHKTYEGTCHHYNKIMGGWQSYGCLKTYCSEWKFCRKCAEYGEKEDTPVPTPCDACPTD